MKKALSLILALVLCLSLCACGGSKTSPEERLNEEAKKFVIAYLNSSVGDLITGSPTVEIASKTVIKENEWAILGTATITTNGEGQTLSAKFGIVATYNPESGEFEFSKVEFDEFE